MNVSMRYDDSQPESVLRADHRDSGMSQAGGRSMYQYI